LQCEVTDTSGDPRPRFASQYKMFSTDWQDVDEKGVEEQDEYGEEEEWQPMDDEFGEGFEEEAVEDPEGGEQPLEGEQPSGSEGRRQPGQPAGPPPAKKAGGTKFKMVPPSWAQAGKSQPPEGQRPDDYRPNRKRPRMEPNPRIAGMVAPASATKQKIVPRSGKQKISPLSAGTPPARPPIRPPPPARPPPIIPSTSALPDSAPVNVAEMQKVMPGFGLPFATAAKAAAMMARGQGGLIKATESANSTLPGHESAHNYVVQDGVIKPHTHGGASAYSTESQWGNQGAGSYAEKPKLRPRGSSGAGPAQPEAPPPKKLIISSLLNYAKDRHEPEDQSSTKLKPRGSVAVVAEGGDGAKGRMANSKAGGQAGAKGGGKGTSSGRPKQPAGPPPPSVIGASASSPAGRVTPPQPQSAPGYAQKAQSLPVPQVTRPRGADQSAYATDDQSWGGDQSWSGGDKSWESGQSWASSEQSSWKATDKASAYATGKASAYAPDRASAYATDKASAYATDKASTYATDKSSAYARGEQSAYAKEESWGEDQLWEEEEPQPSPKKAPKAPGVRPPAPALRGAMAMKIGGKKRTTPAPKTPPKTTSKAQPPQGRPQQPKGPPPRPRQPAGPPPRAGQS